MSDLRQYADYLAGRVLHVDQHLSNVAINYRPEGAIADEVFPIVEVPKQSDLYLIYERVDLLRRPETHRARGARAQTVSWRVSSSTYYAENYALSYPVPIEDEANADSIFRLTTDEGVVNRLKDFLTLDAEVRIANQVTSTTNVGSSVAVGSAWDDYTNSDPLSDIWTGMRNVRRSTGQQPNSIIFSGLAWDHFTLNNNVIDKTWGGGQHSGVSGGGFRATIEKVKELLMVDRVLVGGMFYNTAGEAITENLTEIWGDHVLIYRRPAVASVMEPSFGYGFRWTVPGIPHMAALRHPEDSRRHISKEIELGYYQSEQITASDLSFLITNVTSST